MPSLGNNILNKDFFHHIMSPNRCENFDLVIGNPPFNLPQVNGKEPSRKKYFNDLRDRIGYQSELKIPDENPALHFLVQSFSLLKPDGLLCMIQPSGPLLYKQRLSFKQELFGKYNLLQIIDFTKLADKLWGRKTVPTVAVFIQKSAPDEKNVLHLIADRTFSNKNRLFLEFDHYDFHLIDKYSAINSRYSWKVNLLGGGRLTSNLCENSATIESIDKCDVKMAIHAPRESENELISMADFLRENGKLLRFYILATSSRVGILRATSLYDEDILGLPFTSSSELPWLPFRVKR